MTRITVPTPNNYDPEQIINLAEGMLAKGKSAECVKMLNRFGLSDIRADKARGVAFAGAGVAAKEQPYILGAHLFPHANIPAGYIDRLTLVGVLEPGGAHLRQRQTALAQLFHALDALHLLFHRLRLAPAFARSVYKPPSKLAVALVGKE